MALSVLTGKNQASRSFENSFFRSVASTLSSLFSERKLDGVLLGHPECNADEYLQMDALLITANALVILEFKQRDRAIVHLPAEDAFHTGTWQAEDTRTHIFSTVAGGYANNPFDQVEKKRQRLASLCAQLSINVDIHSLVIFDGDATTSGRIPGQFIKRFSIANASTYVDKITDAINVRSPQPMHDLGTLTRTFTVTQYQDLIPMSPAFLKDLQELGTIAKVRQDTQDQAEAAREAQLAAQLQLAKNMELGRDLEKSQRELQEATLAAEDASARAERALKDFDDKRNALDTARESRKAKEAEHKTEKLRFWKVALILGAVAIAAIIAFVFFQGQSQSSNNALRESYLSGAKCIPVSDAKSFVDAKAVCVSLVVNEVFDKDGYVFLKSNVNPDFEVFITNKALITESKARATYVGKTVEVRGTLSSYKQLTQIKVSDLKSINFTAQ